MAQNLGEIYVELGVRDQKLLRGLDNAQKKLENYNRQIQNISRKAAIGMAALGGSITMLTNRAAKYGDQIMTVANQTGLLTDSVQALSYAASQSNTDMQTLTTGLRSFGRRAAEAAQGNKQFLQGFERLGVSVTQDGNMRRMEDLLLDVADAVSGMGSEAEASAAMMRVMGDAGRRLVPLMRQGSAGIEEMMQQARELGLVMDETSIKRLAVFNDQMSATQQRVSALGRELAVSFLGPLTILNTWIGTIIDRIRGLDDEQRANIARMAVYGTAILAVIASLGIFSKAIMLAMNTLVFFKGVIAAFASPVLLTMGLVAGAAWMVYRAWEENWLGIRDLTTSVVDAILRQWDNLTGWWENTKLTERVGVFWKDLVSTWSSEELTFRERLKETINISLTLVFGEEGKERIKEHFGLLRNAWNNDGLSFLERTQETIFIATSLILGEEARGKLEEYFGNITSIWNNEELSFWQRTQQSLEITIDFLFGSGTWQSITEFWDKVKQTWADALQGFQNWRDAEERTMLHSIFGGVEAALNLVVKPFGNVYEGIKTGLETGDWGPFWGATSEAWSKGVLLGITLSSVIQGIAATSAAIKAGLGVVAVAAGALGVPGALGVLTVGIQLMEAKAQGSFEDFGKNIGVALIAGLATFGLTANPYAGALVFTVAMNLKVGEWIGDTISDAILDSYNWAAERIGFLEPVERITREELDAITSATNIPDVQQTNELKDSVDDLTDTIDEAKKQGLFENVVDAGRGIGQSLSDRFTNWRGGDWREGTTFSGLHGESPAKGDFFKKIEELIEHEGMAILIEAVSAAEGVAAGKSLWRRVMQGMIFDDQTPHGRFSSSRNQAIFDDLIDKTGFEKGSEEFYATAAFVSAQMYWRTFQTAFTEHAGIAIADMDREVRALFAQHMGSGFAPTVGAGLRPAELEHNPHWPGNVFNAWNRLAGTGHQEGTTWTGSGPVDGVAGVVHNQEAVVPAGALKKGIPGILDFFGVPGFQTGRMAGDSAIQRDVLRHLGRLPSETDYASELWQAFKGGAHLAGSTPAGQATVGFIDVAVNFIQGDATPLETLWALIKTPINIPLVGMLLRVIPPLAPISIPVSVVLGAAQFAPWSEMASGFSGMREHMGDEWDTREMGRIVGRLTVELLESSVVMYAQIAKILFGMIPKTLESYLQTFELGQVHPIWGLVQKVFTFAYELLAGALEEIGEWAKDLIKGASPTPGGGVGAGLLGILDKVWFGHVGFAEGTPWTGSGPRDGIAGVVHNQEAVLPTDVLKGGPGAVLSFLGMPGFREGKRPPGVLGTMYDVVKPILDFVIGEERMRGLDRTIGMATELFNQFNDSFGGDIEKVSDAFNKLLGIGEEASEELGGFVGFMKQFGDQVQTALVGILESFETSLTDGVAGVMNAMEFDLSQGFGIDWAATARNAVAGLIDVVAGGIQRMFSSLDLGTARGEDPFPNIDQMQRNFESWDANAKRLQQLNRNIGIATVGGAAAGAGLGAAVGSIIPGVGTLIGAAVGGLFGGIFGRSASKSSSENEMKKLEDALSDTWQSLRQAFNLTIGDLASGLQRAFSADTFEGFVDEFSLALERQTRDALITAFIASDTMRPMLDELSDTIMHAVLSGGITERDRSAIQALYGEITDVSKDFYYALQDLGIATENVSDRMSELGENMRNVPRGFKVALERFSVAEGQPMESIQYENWQPRGTEVTVNFNGDVYDEEAVRRNVVRAVDEANSRVSRATYGGGVR